MQKQTLFILLSVSLFINLYAQETTFEEGDDVYVKEQSKTSSDDQFKDLSLKQAIEQGLRQNYQQAEREIKQESYELSWKKVRNEFWFPQIELSLSSSEHKIFNVRDGHGERSQAPSGLMALSFGEYTLFNWNKDYLAYLNSKDSYQRENQSLSEQRLELKHQIMLKYFELLTSKKLERIAKEQLRNASLIYRYCKERVAVGKSSGEEYYQSRNEYLRAQEEFATLQHHNEILDEQMALLLADPVGTRYVITEDIQHKKTKVTYDDFINIAEAKNPKILDATLNLKNQNRNYEIALKENLPLPKFSVSLGAYSHTFGRNQNLSEYETTEGTSDIDLVATVSASWTMFGGDGFLNENKRAQAMISKRLAEHQVLSSKHTVKSTIREYLKQIDFYQDQVLLLKAKYINIKKGYDRVLDQYLSKTISFVDLQYALRELTITDSALQEAIYHHLQYKILLASVGGIEDFPGENFENLAVKGAVK